MCSRGVDWLGGGGTPITYAVVVARRIDELQRVRGRYVVIADEPIVAESGQAFVVTSLSHSGALIETPGAAQVGSEVEVELGLGRTRFRSSGLVVQSTPIEAEEPDGPSRVGLEFNDPPAAQLQVLRRFIEQELSHYN